jgi:ubiquinone/menaquinone biosynthesis C-methylase UbiE
MSEQNYFAAGSKENEEYKRLSLIEETYDPVTIDCFEKLGVSEGWKCLEVGAGGGSVARWLAKRVGTTGKVVATDINTRFLQHLNETNLEVRQHNILTDPLESDTYDLVHARWVLVHFPEPEKALRRMADALRPGGWLFIEDPDSGPAFSLGSTEPTIKFYIDLIRDVMEYLTKQGILHVYFGRNERSFLERLGFLEIGHMGWTRLYRAGEPLAVIGLMSLQYMKPMALAAGIITEEQASHMTDHLLNPRFTFIDSTVFGAWGKKPG